MRSSPNANDTPAADPRTGAKAFSAEAARAQIMKIIWDRKSSETAVVGYWQYVPLIAVSLAGLTGLLFFVLAPNVAGFVFGYLAIYSVCFAILAMINCKMVRSMNAHFRREAELRSMLIELVRHRSTRSPSPEIKERLSKMERVHLEASERERPKSEMMAAMSALPVAGIAFGYAIMRSIMLANAEHDRNWSEFASQLQAVASGSGKELPIYAGRKTRKANFAAYLALSLLCFPLLAYWYYDMEKGTGLHLREQWRSEDLLAKDLP